MQGIQRVRPGRAAEQELPIVHQRVNVVQAADLGWRQPRVEGQVHHEGHRQDDHEHEPEARTKDHESADEPAVAAEEADPPSVAGSRVKQKEDGDDESSGEDRREEAAHVALLCQDERVPRGEADR